MKQMCSANPPTSSDAIPVRGFFLIAALPAHCKLEESRGGRFGTNFIVQWIIHALAKPSLLSSPIDFHCFQALLTNLSSQPCPFRMFQTEGNDRVSSHNSIWAFCGHWWLFVLMNSSVNSSVENSSVKKNNSFWLPLWWHQGCSSNL